MPGKTNGTNRTTGHSPSALCSVDEFLAQDYDYVIVSGGTAGLCVAARLTENPDVKVGVLEAGADRMDDPQISTPSLYPTLIGRENYLMYVRGSREDYDGWASLGNKGWGWDDLAPYFKKHQTFDPPEKKHPNEKFMHHAAVDKYHGQDGPIHTSFNDYYEPFEEDQSASMETEEARVEYVRNNVSTQYPMIGTCTMGEVVDDKLNVKGVNKLRVIDASIFPGLVSGNIMASTYAVAEKGADLFKADDSRYLAKVDSAKA